MEGLDRANVSWIIQLERIYRDASTEDLLQIMDPILHYVIRVTLLMIPFFWWLSVIFYEILWYVEDNLECYEMELLVKKN